MDKIKFPNVKVDLTNIDGNAFSIMGHVIREMRRQKISQKDIDEYKRECMSGDYDNLLVTTMKYVDCEGE